MRGREGIVDRVAEYEVVRIREVLFREGDCEAPECHLVEAETNFFAQEVVGPCALIAEDGDCIGRGGGFGRARERKPDEKNDDAKERVAHTKKEWGRQRPRMPVVFRLLTKGLSVTGALGNGNYAPRRVCMALG